MWIVHYRLKDGGGGGGGTEESSRRRESFGGSNTPPHLLLSERDELLLIPSSFHPSLDGSSPSASVHPSRQLIYEDLIFIHFYFSSILGFGLPLLFIQSYS